MSFPYVGRGSITVTFTLSPSEWMTWARYLGMGRFPGRTQGRQRRAVLANNYWQQLAATRPGGLDKESRL